MKIDKFLTDEESNHLECFLKSRLKAGKNVRDCLLILIGLKTGARASEVLALTKNAINEPEGSLCVIGLKGGNERQLPIERAIMDALIGYVVTVEGNLVFPISYSRYRQIWNKYRPVKKKLHSLRHGCALKVYNKTKDIRIVQQVLGHKSLQSTLCYQTYVYSQEQLKKALL